MRQASVAVIAVAALALALTVWRPSEAPVLTAEPTVSHAAATTTTATTAPRPTARAFALTVTDADLTKAAASGFPRTVNGVTVTDPDVHVDDSGVRLVAKARILFGTAQFAMTATPLVTNGTVTVRVDSATLAGVSLPSDTRASIADTVQTTISRMLPANVRVTNVALSPGVLTVQGTQP